MAATQSRKISANSFFTPASSASDAHGLGEYRQETDSHRRHADNLEAIPTGTRLRNRSRRYRPAQDDERELEQLYGPHHDVGVGGWHVAGGEKPDFRAEVADHFPER